MKFIFYQPPIVTNMIDLSKLIINLLWVFIHSSLVLPIFLMTITYVCFKLLVKDDITFKKIPPQNWPKTVIFGGIYIGFYFLLVIILRVLSITQGTDLKKYFQLYLEFIQAPFYDQIIQGLFGLFLLFFWIYIFIKIRTRLAWHFWQIHFYYVNVTRIQDDHKLIDRLNISVEKEHYYAQLYLVLVTTFRAKYSLYV